MQTLATGAPSRAQEWRAPRPDYGGAGATSPSGPRVNQAALLDLAMVIWFAVTALSAIYVAWDAFTTNPEMRVMKWEFLLITLFGRGRFR